MTNKSTILDIDYSLLQFDNPHSFVKYALKLTEQITNERGARINRISYMRGERKRQGKARIFLDNLQEVTINSPRKTRSAAKLAHLLWALSRCGAIPAHILCTGHKDYGLSTKCPQTHESKLQKGIKEAMHTYGAVKSALSGPLEKGLSKILTREVTPEQVKMFDHMPEDKKRLWREFAKYSSTSGKISFDNFLRLTHELKLDKEKVFGINEDYFGLRGLDFDIDYGSVSFYQHYSEKQKLKGKVERLEKEKKDLETRLSKKS